MDETGRSSLRRARQLTTLALVVAIAAIGMSACGSSSTTPSASGEASPVVVSAADSPAATARPGADHAARCATVCATIRGLHAPGPDPEAWTERCTTECGTWTSEGQLDCYEAVRRVEDVTACKVR